MGLGTRLSRSSLLALLASTDICMHYYLDSTAAKLKVSMCTEVADAGHLLLLGFSGPLSVDSNVIPHMRKSNCKF